MEQRTTHRTPAHRTRVAVFCASVVTVLAGCAGLSTVAVAPPPNAVPMPPAKITTPSAARSVSRANTQEEYRREVAKHLYEQNSARIFGGRLPPLLYAVGVLETDIDARGNVTHVRWMRAPSHAPEVMAEIERTVRLAAPYPAPAKLGRVTTTETWLWDKSGRFQLHTLSEGQL